MDHKTGITNKVLNFLLHVGARNNPRKFRKVKRIAKKRWPYGDTFDSIYYAFELNRFTQYGGYYWPDLRPLLTEPDPNGGYWPKRRRVSQEEFGSCRVWSLHGPVKQNYVPHCAWCSTETDIEKRIWPGQENSEKPVVEFFCEKCHDKVRHMVEERKAG